VSLHEKLGRKVKRGGKGTPAFESVDGHDLHRDTGKWNHLERSIDRENNRYRERIVDGDTGEVIREVDEALSAHRGRESARRGRPSNTDC
jgi:hypothetical protein